MPGAFQRNATGSRAPSPHEYEAVKEILQSVGSIDPMPKMQELPLIYSAKEGDQDAMQTLIRAYIRLILRIASQYGPSTVPLPDRVQDGILGLMDAVHRYDDPSGQTPLLSFAKWRILMHVQREERSYREPAVDTLSMDEEAPYVQIDDTVIVEKLDTHSEIDSILRVARAYMDANERDVFLHHYTESGTPLPAGLTAEEERRLLHSAQQKLRAYWIPNAGSSPATSKRDVIPESRLELVPVSSIRVGDRIRRDMGAISALVESIRRIGLLHPLVISRDNWLLVGYRRLVAVQILGWDTAPVTRRGEVYETGTA